MLPFLLLTCACLLFSAGVSAQSLDNQLNQFSRAVQNLTARISPSVVRVMATRYGTPGETGRADVVAGQQQSVGSGIIVNSDGYILTNAHVIDGARTIKVDLVSAGEQTIPGVLARSRTLPVDATVVGAFKEGDIALLKVAKTGLPALPFADYDKLQQGQIVFAFGSPEGMQNSVSMGVVSSIARQPNLDSPFIYIQTDTAINPGNSGGPLVNAAGEIVGMNTFILSKSGGNEGVGFAIPSMLLKWVSANLQKYGHVHRSSVGIGLQGVTPVLARALKLPTGYGVVISDITPGGAAEAAGLKINDVLVSADGRPIDSVPAMMGFFFQHGPGEHVKFELLRGSEKLSVDLVPVEEKHDADHLADFLDPTKDVIESLGILGTTVNKQIEAVIGGLRLPTGVVVAARVEGRPMAQDSGLQTGDVIHSINGDFIYTIEALNSALALLKPGDAIALLVERHGLFLYVSFEL